jgi:hypothetical protein
MLKDQWSNMVWPASEEAISDPDTGVERETLKLIGRASVKVPEEFVRGSDYFFTRHHLLRFILTTGNPSEITAPCQASSRNHRFRQRT